SPLISLMKDQVDGLRACGYPAAALYSGLSPEQRREMETGLARGQYRLVFVAPERLLTPPFLRLLDQVKVRAFAIDEAHCISHWGHDFRPEYRQLATLKERFPGTSIHAYTATATERVRQDIIAQLRLENAAVWVGTFDRPNLVYRVVPRVDAHEQTATVLRRHAGSAVIVYCLSRKDTEAMAARLRRSGIKAEAYHAGLDADTRRRIQDAFAAESLNAVVATVAFGMGIDRSNVRCVVHASMPKSVEHYQQETGRAGRDGLAAECVLLYSASDAQRWDCLITKSAAEAEAAEEVVEAARRLLRRMQRYANAAVCRHRALSEYFGQPYERENCGACDICLDEAEGVEDGTVVAQKILSCVARVQERFGVGHVVDVLLGGDTEMIRRHRHDQLSTYGLMKDMPRKTVMNLLYQLIDQGLLQRSDGDRPVLQLSAVSWEVLRGQREVRLTRPRTAPVRKTKAEAETWADVDKDLFERLRTVRKEVARRRGVPPYLIFTDVSLRDMARVAPKTLDDFLRVNGVGRQKLKSFGREFVDAVREYLGEPPLASLSKAVPTKPRSLKMTAARRAAYELFEKRIAVDDAAEFLRMTPTRVLRCLREYISQMQPDSIDAWVRPGDYAPIAEAAKDLGTRSVRLIHDRLEGRVTLDTIRLVTRHLEVRQDGDHRPGESM
ncbi:MAG: RecQ family ATP-dependent DNA helicase, partial [Phycisphaerae bacterium]|nr:RecQ family ATP-dependent DNA helicase [Phycisphaerae bacterium]